MKNRVSKLKQHPKYHTVLNWIKIISITGSAQMIVQAVGFICGILIIRLLPVQEYAFYTVANTMLGTMVLLSDGGISAGVMSEGGKVWKDKYKLGAVLATGLDLRKKFATVSLFVSVPILFYLLMHNGASILTTSLIALALIPSFYAALSDSLLQIVPKLHQNIISLQKNQLIVGMGRLFLTALTVFVFPWSFIVILAAGLPRFLGNIKLQKIAHVFASKEQKSDNEIRTNILAIVKRQMPESIYFCLSGQINIWLISIFGSTAALASLGALGRFSVITGFLTLMFSTLITPRFARMAEDRKQMQKKMLYILLILLLSSLLIITVAYIFSNQFLWVLGKNYYGINREFVLIVIANCVSLLQGVFFSINLAKGWIISPTLYITISISTTLFAFVLMDVSTLSGVIIFGMFIASFQALVLISYCFYRTTKLQP